MPFDAVFLSAVTAELRQAEGARVDKVNQPSRDTVLLQLRGPAGSWKLLLDANTGHPRIHFTAESFENPAAPPMFCMLLRKHLVGGRLLALRQPPMERVAELVFSCTDELGDPVEKRLVLELMGRNSNLVLVGGDGRIIDCLRRVDFEMSEQRQVLPGLFYELPPTQGKLLPQQTPPALLESQLLRAEGRLDQWLLDSFAGLSPLICRELSYRLTGSADADLGQYDPVQRQQLAQELAARFAALDGPYTPVLLRREGVPKDFSYTDIGQYGGFMQSERAESFSALLDLFYTARDRAERIRARTAELHKQIANLCARTARKLEAQRRELEATHDRERLRQMGDLVTANLHRIQRGQTVLETENFYDPDMAAIAIPLSPTLSPQKNAARYYKEYAKAKTAESVLTGQIARGEAELDYLSSVLDELSRAESDRDVTEIRQELTDGGYLRQQRGKGKAPRQAALRPRHFRSSEGFDIYVGRNNRQNDQLTLKDAVKTDLWFHAQKIHGSHVIVDCDRGQPGEETIRQAAQLAAQFSQAAAGQNVPVDYTAVRNVKKPVGAKPGMVIYDHYNTAYVTPDPDWAASAEVR